MIQRLESYFDRLWPITRSLTGNGNRETFAILSEIVDFTMHEIPAGTQCFDWNVPPEWNVSEAWIKNSKGETIVDMRHNNLHLLGYSEPFRGKLSLEELRPHLYSLPDQPDLIPYLTSYYQRRWGFCLPHNDLIALPEDEYDVCIDSSLNDKGSMTLGEAYIQGTSSEEILFSTYICHPSLANNELSGPLVTAFIYDELKKKTNLRYSYRFIFHPETIGSICYLSMVGEHLKKSLAAGFVVTCIGDPGSFTYKRSRRKNSLADRVVETVLKQTEEYYHLVDFFPSGSDERQYCSPGFNLPVGSLMRTMYGKYPQYHTSADNKDFISFAAMKQSVAKYMQVIDALENNYTFINTIPHCEPQLGKRGLYPTLGSQKSTADTVDAMMWLLNLSDGTNDILAIAAESGMKLELLHEVARTLQQHGILKIAA
jgi:aminopeptidase-like protein